MNADADFHDLSARTLTDADVIAGGTTIHLDWSRSSRIRDELLWWTIPRAGDARSPYAEVTGLLNFIPLKNWNRAPKLCRRAFPLTHPFQSLSWKRLVSGLVIQTERSGGLNRIADALWLKKGRSTNRLHQSRRKGRIPSEVSRRVTDNSKLSCPVSIAVGVCEAAT